MEYSKPVCSSENKQPAIITITRLKYDDAHQWLHMLQGMVVEASKLVYKVKVRFVTH